MELCDGKQDLCFLAQMHICDISPWSPFHSAGFVKKPWMRFRGQGLTRISIGRELIQCSLARCCPNFNLVTSSFQALQVAQRAQQACQISFCDQPVVCQLLWIKKETAQGSIALKQQLACISGMRRTRMVLRDNQKVMREPTMSTSSPITVTQANASAIMVTQQRHAGLLCIQHEPEALCKAVPMFQAEMRCRLQPFLMLVATPALDTCTQCACTPGTT